MGNKSRIFYSLVREPPELVNLVVRPEHDFFKLGPTMPGYWFKIRPYKVISANVTCIQQLIHFQLGMGSVLAHGG